MNADKMIIAYTDGSQEKGYTGGAGVQFVNPEKWNLRNISTELEGEPSSSRAELYAIYLAVLETEVFSKVPLIIRTDSR